VITKRSCTEPSLTPLLFLKRGSRIGPFWSDEPGHGVLRALETGNGEQGILRGAGSASVWLRVARETLVGIEAGTEALFEPLVTDSISENLASPSLKKAVSSAVRPVSGAPAPAGPPRTARVYGS